MYKIILNQSIGNMKEFTVLDNTVDGALRKVATYLRNNIDSFNYYAIPSYLIDDVIELDTNDTYFQNDGIIEIS